MLLKLLFCAVTAVAALRALYSHNGSVHRTSNRATRGTSQASGSGVASGAGAGTHVVLVTHKLDRAGQAGRDAAAPVYQAVQVRAHMSYVSVILSPTSWTDLAKPVEMPRLRCIPHVTPAPVLFGKR